MLDRVIQQALAQVLTPLFESGFSAHSYGFREGRNAHQAVREVEACWQEGRRYAVDCDLKSFLETSSHYPRSDEELVEEGRQSVGNLDAQAFSPSAAHMHRVEFATLYTLQHGLASDAEEASGFEHRHVAVGGPRPTKRERS